MARITAGVASSHVPAIGVAVDLGKTQDEYWSSLFKGYEFTKQWIAEAVSYTHLTLPTKA